MEHIWIFKGNGNSPFPAAVFSSKKNADTWIKNNCLSGILIKYPIDMPLYNWAIDSGFFTPKSELQKTPQFIQNFTCASVKDYHYENGIEE